MKIIILFILIISLNANIKDEVLKILNYSFNVDFSKIHSPFLIEQPKKIKEKNTTKPNKPLKLKVAPIPIKNKIVKPIKMPKVNHLKNLKLQIIFNNKVLINNKWYKNKEKIFGYEIIIKDNKVLLKKGNKIKILSLIKPSINIILKPKKEIK